MKAIHKSAICLIGIWSILVVTFNWYYQKEQSRQVDRVYMVELNRVQQRIIAYEQEYSRPPASFDVLNGDLESVYKIEVMSTDEQDFTLFLNQDFNDYKVFATKNNLYKLYYKETALFVSKMQVGMNVVLGSMLFIMLLFIWVINRKVLKPFERLASMPYDLAKGNLSKPLMEQKGKFFGRFLWGMDLLREHLEQTKERELSLQKEKKVLLMSLSHEIKTPLSAIQLYASAIQKNLYKEEEKRIEVATSINHKVNEIEDYVSKIVKVSNEDFLQFEVNNKEFYIQEVCDQLRDYYQDKMKYNQIEFQVHCDNNSLVYGDPNRLIEVLQNIVENAIKYGDGHLITVSAKREEEEYCIRIENTGCDLDRGELPKIFESFYRGSNAINKKGSGLGLAICRKIIHQMDGEVLAKIVEKKDTINQPSGAAVMQIKIVLRVV